MSGVEAMIAQAESFLGTNGRPNRITQWYASRNGSYFSDAAWCDMSVTYWAYHSGNYDAVCHGKDYAYTVWHAQRFSDSSEWHTDTAGIRRGDILFFDWAGSDTISRIDHVGIVTGVSGKDVFTIEGNTENKCARRVRRANTIVGYGRPNYAADAPSDDREKLRVYFNEVKYGLRNDSVHKVQQMLKAEVGLDFSSAPGLFDPRTLSKYAEYQRKLGFSGPDANGHPGITSLSRLCATHGYTLVKK